MPPDVVMAQQLGRHGALLRIYCFAVWLQLIVAAHRPVLTSQKVLLHSKSSTLETAIL